MSIRTHITFLNGNDPNYLEVKGSPELTKQWEENWGPIEDHPGAEIEADDIVQETNEEYGGWLIKLSDLPKEATHILIRRF